MAVYRVYVEKSPEYAVEAQGLLKEIRHILLIKSVTGVRVLNRYDVEGIERALFDRCMPVVFSEPPVDVTYDRLPEGADAVIAVEYLPGQFDARAASCEECIQLVSQGERPTVRTARVYLFTGAPTPEELDRIRRHLINPVESREADLAEKETLRQQYDTPETVETLEGFNALDGEEIAAFVQKYGLAMDRDDLAFCQAYFQSEQRDPTITEIRMIDTYWSDHCRHTTFLTTLDDVKIEKPAVEAAFKRYLSLRQIVYAGRVGGPKPMNLMDVATIGAKALKAQGKLPNLDESEEINACSIKIDVDVDGRKEPWLLMFKNETHNHPTEIEPFGGAATCIGGAIRDPLSGRTYVYQAMRVTGAADPLVPVADTMPGKLPQRKLVTTAAAGLQRLRRPDRPGDRVGGRDVPPRLRGQASGDRRGGGRGPGAQRAPRAARRPAIVIILLGGRTGRDGCGGATGSSKVPQGGEHWKPAAPRCKRATPSWSASSSALFRQRTG